jgi:hypothetical protein
MWRGLCTSSVASVASGVSEVPASCVVSCTPFHLHISRHFRVALFCIYLCHLSFLLPFAPLLSFLATPESNNNNLYECIKKLPYGKNGIC